MLTGLLVVPVASFSLAPPSSSMMMRSLLSTTGTGTGTALHVSTQAQEQALGTGTGMEPTEIDIDIDITVMSSPHANANANAKKSAPKKNRKGKQRRNPAKDIHFLIKRTNQIISQEPISNSSNSSSSTSTASNTNTSTVTIQTFHWLMDAWTASLHPTAPEHSLSLMNCMKEYNIQPSSKTLTKVLNAYGKCGRGGEAAQEIIDSCINATNSDSCSIPLLDLDLDTDTNGNNVFVYNALLEAYAEKPVFGSEGSVRNAVKTEQLLDQMMQEKGMVPNGRSFQAVIRAWGNSNVEIGALKGEQILDRMEKMVKSGEMDASEGPTVIHYNAVLDAWANSVLDNHAQRGEGLLNKMMVENKVQPNTISFNACIDAYAKNGDGDKAEELLNKMDDLWRKQGIKEFKPDTRSYNSVMNAFSKSLEKNAAAKAETILRKMEVKPDFFSFAIVINAWARSLEYGKAKKAQQLYLEMVDLYNKGNRKLRPNGKFFVLISMMQELQQCIPLRTIAMVRRNQTMH